MIDFRAKYKIVDHRWVSDGSGHFEVHRKPWWSPFWRRLNGPPFLFILFCDTDDSQERINTNFKSMREAIAFADKHARHGIKAFFKTRYTLETFHLGKLP